MGTGGDASAQRLPARTWRAGDPAAPRSIAPGHVEVWLVSLDFPPIRPQRLLRCLDPDERARSERFRTALLRSRFAHSRALLRSLLAYRLDVAPADLVFGAGPNGKPYVPQRGFPAVEFNLSHSGPLAAIAIAEGLAVGVDIEAIRRDFGHDDVARVYFTASERAALDAVAGDRRIETFYRIWTRKEAALKAFGVGIGGDGGPLRVPVSPATCAVPESGSFGRSPFTTVDFPALEGFAGALAVLAPGLDASWRTWQ